jgi:membrane protease YdiL (CAAX protease family)
MLIAVVWYLGPRRYRVPISSLGLTSPGLPWPHTLLLAVGALGVSLGATALYALVIKQVGPDRLLPPDIPKDIVFPGLTAVFTFQALALWTPLAEEVFFRGFVFAGLVSYLGTTGAAVTSALIFSIFHLNPGLIVPVFVTGLLLAWLYHRTDSLWASFLAHAGQNALALAVTIYGARQGGQV